MHLFWSLSRQPGWAASELKFDVAAARSVDGPAPSVPNDKTDKTQGGGVQISGLSNYFQFSHPTGNYQVVRD